jgi:small subunit ribosomal protein S8
LLANCQEYLKQVGKFMNSVSKLLTNIVNAQIRGKQVATCVFSKLNLAILSVMKNGGMIDDFRLVDSGKFKAIEVILSYDEKGSPKITSVEQISTGSVKRYSGYKDLKKMRVGAKLVVVSTSKGVMSAKDAQNSLIGGEVLCRIY